MHISLISLLTESLPKEPHPRKNGVYYPSEVGACLRKVFYTHTMPPAQHSMETLLVFTMGDAVHDKLASMFKTTRNVRLIANEKSFVAPIEWRGQSFTISGCLDDLVQVWVPGAPNTQPNPEKCGEIGKTPEEPPINQENPQQTGGKWHTFVVDVKSTKSVDHLAAAKPEHAFQVFFYLRCLQHSYPDIVGKLLYVEKNSFAMKEFDVEYTDAAWKASLDRYAAIHAAVSDPDRTGAALEPEAKTSQERAWECNYCPFRARCDLDVGPSGVEWKKAEAHRRMKPGQAGPGPVEAYL
jgi:CRISPR-associated exonuclease Cas4